MTAPRAGTVGTPAGVQKPRSPPATAFSCSSPCERTALSLRPPPLRSWAPNTLLPPVGLILRAPTNPPCCCRRLPGPLAALLRHLPPGGGRRHWPVHLGRRRGHTAGGQQQLCQQRRQRPGRAASGVPAGVDGWGRRACLGPPPAPAQPQQRRQGGGSGPRGAGGGAAAAGGGRRGGRCSGRSGRGGPAAVQSV